MQQSVLGMVSQGAISFILNFLKITFVCVHILIHTMKHVWRQRTTCGSRFFPSTLWVLEIELQSPYLSAIILIVFHFFPSFFFCRDKSFSLQFNWPGLSIQTKLALNSIEIDPSASSIFIEGFLSDQYFVDSSMPSTTPGRDNKSNIEIHLLANKDNCCHNRKENGQNYLNF